MNLDKLSVLINNIKYLAKDPELFLTSKYQRHRNLTGFRIELYTAKKYNTICSKLKWLKLTNLKATGIITEQDKNNFRTTHFSQKTP